MYLHAAKNEVINGIVPYQKFFMSYVTLHLKRKLQQVGHMWVTSRLFCGSVGQMGQQVWPTFNPGPE